MAKTRVWCKEFGGARSPQPWLRLSRCWYVSLIHRASQGTGIRIEFVANADHHKPHDGHGSNLPMDHD